MQRKENKKHVGIKIKEPQMALSIRLNVFINHYTPILCRRTTYGLTNSIEKKTEDYFGSRLFHSAFPLQWSLDLHTDMLND